MEYSFWITNGRTYGSYDYLSIMHYPANPDYIREDRSKPIFTTHDPDYQNRVGGQRSLSRGDINTLGKLYGSNSPTIKIMKSAHLYPYLHFDSFILKYNELTDVYFKDMYESDIVYDYRYDAYRMLIGDYNGDGADEVLTRFNGLHRVYTSGQWNNSLCNGYVYDGDYDVEGWVAGDFDGDGDDEVLTKFYGLATTYKSDDHVTTLCGSHVYDGKYHVEKWIVGDFDGDADDEVLVKFAGLHKIYVSNDDATTLCYGSAYDGDYDVENWVVGDFDGDGDDDIITKFKLIHFIFWKRSKSL